MYTFENKHAWFEQALQSNHSDEGVNYTAIEAGISRRIRECEEMGLLGLLTMEEIPDTEKMEQVEYELFSQITQFSEYDEPVNECLSGDIDLSEKQWDRLTEKLDERLAPVLNMPLWEQQFLAPHEEPTIGNWEAVESLLFDRINRSDSQMREMWEQYEIKEEPVATVSLEVAEDLLDRHISSVASRQYWEHIIAAESIFPISKWESIENDFFSAIDSSRRMPIDKQPFWFILEHYASMLKGVAVTGVALAFVVFTGIGITRYHNDMAALPTMVYQVDGSSTGRIDMSSKIENQCSATPGGSVTLVNSHGSIKLHDNSALKIERLSNRVARYSVDFSSGNKASEGDVAFFVRKTNKKRDFTVATPHYVINVTGTYFRVESDINGSVVTNVLEGKVRITNGPFGDTSLYAGQSLRFDSAANRYLITGGGETVMRDEMEKMPEMADLVKYTVITFDSYVSGARIQLNGKQYGITPLKLRLPPGEYATIITQSGYQTLDTLLSVSGNRQEYRFKLPVLKSETIVKPVRKGSGRVAGLYENSHKTHNEQLHIPETTCSVQGTDIGKLYADAQMADRNKSWRKAINLYKRVFNDPNVTALRREDALFSIGKLQADHISDIEAAKKTFLNYLALFPSGSFAGESWLRLAELEFRKNQENAINYYLKFFEQFPRHPKIAELQDRVGVIYLQKKRYAKAIDMFDKALANSGLSEENAREIAAHLHRALVDYGETARAQAVHTRYLLSEK